MLNFSEHRKLTIKWMGVDPGTETLPRPFNPVSELWYQEWWIGSFREPYHRMAGYRAAVYPSGVTDGALLYDLKLDAYEQF